LPNVREADLQAGERRPEERVRPVGETHRHLAKIDWMLKVQSSLNAQTLDLARLDPASDFEHHG
jgi:hypothetical protein